MSDSHVHNILNAVKKEHFTVCNNVLNIYSVQLNATNTYDHTMNNQ